MQFLEMVSMKGSLVGVYQANIKRRKVVETVWGVAQSASLQMH